MKARAKRIDNGELTYGNIFDTGEESLITFIDYSGHWIDREVDPTTIEYEVNGEWLSEEEVQNRCAITKNLCEDQKEWIETTNHLKEENTRLRAEVERLEADVERYRNDSQELRREAAKRYNP